MTELYIESLVAEYNINRELKARVLTDLWQTVFIRNYVDDEPEDAYDYEPDDDDKSYLDYCSECRTPLANIPANEIAREYYSGSLYKYCSWQCRRCSFSR